MNKHENLGIWLLLGVFMALLYAAGYFGKKEPAFTKCKVIITSTGYKTDCNGGLVDITVEKEGGRE